MNIICNMSLSDLPDCPKILKCPKNQKNNPKCYDISSEIGQYI